MECKDQVICCCFESRSEMKQVRIEKAVDESINEIIKIKSPHWVSTERR